MGWRGAFLCLVPVAGIAVAWQWVSLPSMQAERRGAGSGQVFKLFKSRSVVPGMAACGAFFMGQFALFTYVRPFLERVTQVEVSALSLILLLIGAAGFIGTTLIGAFLRRVQPDRERSVRATSCCTGRKSWSSSTRPSTHPTRTHALAV